jgi:integrase
VVWAQLPLFVVPRDYRYGRVDLLTDPALENPWLAWALHLAHTMAEARGFREKTLTRLNATLIMLLAEHRDGEQVRSSDFYPVLRKRGIGAEHTSEVLEQMGVLLDDRPPAFSFEKWLAEKLEGLAPGISSETETWAHTLHEGGPRSRARDPATTRIYVRFARPALLEWSKRYNNLRQVTREDILAHVDRLYGQERQLTLVALKSLFTWAKKSDVIFRNPTSQIKGPRPDYPIWQPLHPDEVACTIEAATTPQARLFVVLAAVHAARTGAIRALQLDDVDLPNRRLTIAGRTRPLDELTHQLLLQWLDHRRQRWPNTANQHLLINIGSALGLGPVSARWATKILSGLPGTLERLRIDRQLEEALAHRADPLHLAAVFDIHADTAIRYADSARQLLEEPHETNPTGSPRTQGSTTNKYPTEHLGSR